MCDERAGSRLTRLYSKLRTRLDARSMIEQIQFRQWNVLVHGTNSVTTRRKAQRVRHFEDISPAELPVNQSAEDSAEMPAALSDNVGDDWLETPIVSQIPEELPAPVSLFKGGDIDLTSYTLINALSTAPIPALPKFEDSDAEDLGASTQHSLLPITRVGDIEWD
ncbi:hypothetical protein FRC12_009680 [Ceratobasidium sp. 428]|nr:hypothetical protein FRC12_009680 [Ceratobasidium sp. 428]